MRVWSLNDDAYAYDNSDLYWDLYDREDALEGHD